MLKISEIILFWGEKSNILKTSVKSEIIFKYVKRLYIVKIRNTRLGYFNVTTIELN